MSIDVHFHGASVAELHLEMHALLIGHANRLNTTAAATGAVNTETPKRQTAAEKKAAEKAAAAAPQGIQTGEERTDPAVDAQDAADEAAEKPAEPVKLTHDSVRAMLGGYVQAYGMAAAQEDGTKLIEVPKISDLKDDQAVLAKAVIAIATGIEKNPHKRGIAGDGITAEKLAELKPVVTAAMAVK